MTAHSENFPWPSYYGHYKFFEDQMSRHRQVEFCLPEGSGVYQIGRKRGDKLRIFICECYAFGIAEYIETNSRIDCLNAVIINSAWCAYSLDAKRYCRNKNVGLFKIAEFMGALHRDHYWTQLTEQEEKHFKEQGWL